MKLSALCLAGFTAGAFGKCITKPCSGKCVAVVAEVGEAFCSSYLSLEPVTKTVTETDTVTAVQTRTETAVDVVTLTTLTTTITATAKTVYAKREEPSATADLASRVLAQCGSAESSVSSACSCILSTATASTVTVVETVTATEAADATVTTTATVTSGVVATAYATPTVTVTNPIVNGDFENYLNTGNILPWTNTGTGRLDIVNGVNPCSNSGGTVSCAGGRVVVRVYPPTTGQGYFGLKETFTAEASSTYGVSFLYRCLNYDANTRIDVYWKGAKIGTTNGCISSAPFIVASGIQFTTDETGTGELEIRFMNPSNLPYLYFYADAFQATRIA